MPITKKILLFTLLAGNFAFQVVGQSYAQTQITNTPSKPDFEFYFRKGETAMQQKQYLIAEAYFDSARNNAITISDEINIAKCYSKLGTVKKIIGDLDLALEYYNMANDIFEKLHKYDLLTASHVDLAEFYRKVGKFALALENIEKAKEIYTLYHLSDTVLLIKIYNRSAAINNEYNPNMLSTFEDSYKAIDLARSIGSDADVAVSLNELGFAYKNLLKVGLSDSCYKEAERLWIKTGQYDHALHAMNNRAMLYVHNSFDKALIIPVYKQIDRMIDSLDIDFSNSDPFYYLYRNSLETGDSAEALYYFTKAHDIDIQNAIKLHDYNLHNLTSKYENKRIKTEFENVSSKLNESSHELETKKRETRLLISFLIILVILTAIITFLLLKIRKSNSILKDKNKEKDALIQEIHHRVKNNLQFISSLINMQLKTTQNDEETKTLSEASRRINAMALVHEMLYNQADQKGISSKNYLEELTDSLYALVNSENQKIEFDLDIADIHLSISDTISIGMITSELVSNSMKHAFKDICDPAVKISLTEYSGGSLVYTIEDNGIGLKENYQVDNRLGLRLVDIFSRQLKGTYTISGKSGFAYTLNFNRRKNDSD